MKVFNVSIMPSVQVTYILLFLSLCASILTFPSTPLDEKSQEISWQAWLLVDDQNQQNQNRQSGGAGDDLLSRRRLFPKSVFVAPTFSPENLPPCADGYSSDDMGRCIKIIKIDEDRHLEFLVSKLNDKFGVIDYEEEVEEMDTTKSEPFQLNIPLNLDDTDYSSDTPQEDLDFAIIVTPTTRDSDHSYDGAKVDKRNDQSNENVYEKELWNLLKMTTTKTYDDTTRNEDFEQSTDVAHYTTDGDTTETTTVHTVEDSETTIVHTTEEREETTTVVTTTGEVVEETTVREEINRELGSLIEPFEAVDATTYTEVSAFEGTTEEPTTIESSKPTKSTSTTPKITTVTPKITTYHPKVITYHPYLDLRFLDNSKTKNLIKFPDVDEKPAIPRNHPDGGFVRFPDVDSKYQQESQIHHTRDVNDQSGNYFNEIVTSEPSHRVQEMVLPPKGAFKGSFSGFFPSEARQIGPETSDSFHRNIFPSKDVAETSNGFHLPLVNQHKYQYNLGATTERHPAKKSREKHGSMFVISPKWSQSNQQKPLVLRFSRKHFNVDTNKFKNNEFYRSLPMDDLSFLFGYKKGQTSHR